MTAKDLMRLLGRNLKQYRTNYGETQEKFAERIGVSISAYKNLELGARATRFETIASIATALNVEPADLFRSSRDEIVRSHIDELLLNRPESFIITVEKMIQALDEYDASLGESGESSGR